MMNIRSEPTNYMTLGVNTSCLAPVNTIAPIVSGIAKNGNTLSVTNGTWAIGSPTIIFTYQWQRDGSDIGGETNNTYILTVADISHTVRCVVTGTNSCGNSSANSNGKVITSTLLDDLISYWKMDEASAGVAPVTRNDSVVTSANNLTDTNNTPSDTGIINNGANISKSLSQQLSKNSNASLQTGDIDFSVALWFKPTSLTTLDYIVGKSSDLGSLPNIEWCIFISTHTPVFRLSNGVSPTDLNANTALTIGTWNLIIVKHDSINNIAYIKVNNNAIASVSYSAGVAINTKPFRFGFDGSIRRCDGVIDECGFWKKVLTSNEDTILYNAGAGVTYPNFA